MIPFVSVVIPCRNEGASLERCLESVLGSDYPPERMEILVSDGMSEDGTRELLKRFSGVRVLDNLARITPAALNLAVGAARGDFIVRVDAHSTIAPGYVPGLVEFLLQHPDAWGAGGRMATEPETNGMFAGPIVEVLSNRFGVGNSAFRTGGDEVQKVDTVFNCCWRRDVFDRVGLFHEQLVRSQDIEMSARIARAGGSLWLVPQAETTYFARTGFVAYLRHNWLNGIWSLLPAAYLGRLPVAWRHLIPLVFVAALLGSLAAGVALHLAWLPLLVGAPYVLANLMASCEAGWRRRSYKLAFLLPLTFSGLHFAYGAGSLYGAIRVAANLVSGPTPHDPSTNPIHPIL